MKAKKPLVVGIGGTLRADSSTERVLRHCLASAERLGAETKLFCGEDLDLPMYNPYDTMRTAKATALVAGLRAADAVVVASPGYHGAVSGLVKNALDYAEDLRAGTRTYLADIRWGAIACAYGWQAAVGTLGQLRTIGHALRAWPTPLGVAINSATATWGPDGSIEDQSVIGQIDCLAAQLLDLPADSV
ncbi:FMN reductase [Mycobacterium sp. Root265]|uniref:NADPH-dependent FMN reductase n=1 Tax=Mycobacterium sp. Root265 TaxID=1736504 RepID=UPI00070C0A92|nr:NAD(P)H-dependent oxidoreductase [Mycobacterium sp. Root265]KRD05973.1 FMN reductase [Mycobacterium sp. Root265]